MQVELLGRYLPRDRRDLNIYMVDNSVANFFAICVKIKLFDASSVRPSLLVDLSIRLFRLVKRRHTHLWDLPISKS